MTFSSSPLTRLLCCGLFVTSSFVQAGQAYIVGGGTLSDPIYQRFVDEAGSSTARICLFGVNSGDPEDSMDFYQEKFEALGATTQKIAITMGNSAWNTQPFYDGGLTFDDPEREVRTTDARLSESVDIADTIRNCNAIWFGGGNQSRGTFVLLNEDGSATPAMTAIKEVIADGGIFGGTSAGSALQSDPMIVIGNSLDSLTTPPGPVPVVTHHGLGILPEGLLVDQHFLERGRLGRLVAALRAHDIPLGAGVDEDTALLVDLDTSVWEVVGSRQVLIVAQDHEQEAQTLVHLLGHGDLWDAATGLVTVADPLADITGDPYEPSAPIFRLGVFNPQVIPSLLTLAVDTRDQETASGLDFLTDGAASFATMGVKVRFSQTEQTTAWLCFSRCRESNPLRSGKTARYSVTHMKLDITSTALAGSDLREQAESYKEERRARKAAFKTIVREARDLLLR